MHNRFSLEGSHTITDKVWPSCVKHNKIIILRGMAVGTNLISMLYLTEIEVLFDGQDICFGSVPREYYVKKIGGDLTQSCTSKIWVSPLRTKFQC